MEKIAIITGANRGLGKELADQLLRAGDTLVIAISRSVHTDHQSLSADKFIFLETDLGATFNPDGLNKLAFQFTHKHIMLFSNAGTIQPLERIGTFAQHDIANSIAVNVSYPVSLINFLMSKYSHQPMQLVNITSGAGNRAIESWGAYCSAKAYMLMFFKTLEAENKDNTNLRFYSIDPGVMDTAMQQQIRDGNFPAKDYFTSLKENNELIQPKDAAEKILKAINFYQE